MTPNEIKRILFEHEAWLNGSGVRANLRGANLRDANLCDADLRNANLCNANLCRADLRSANLCLANLCHADLREAKLSGVRLIGVQYDESTVMLAMACPEKGAFIGYKKAAGYIIELLILDDARRSSATSRKCRCDKAKVISITTLDGRDAGLDSVFSDWDSTFTYTVGSVVEEPRYCTDRWVECAPGIHFFMTRGEAVNYD